MFLKYLDDLEKDKETAALLSGKTYERIIEPQFRWNTWATPKIKQKINTKNGATTERVEVDHNAMTGDDLVDFVNGELFPYLKRFKTNAESENSWTVNIAGLPDGKAGIDQTTFDLSVKNPNTPEEAPLREPKEILKEMAKLDKQSASILENIKGLI